MELILLAYSKISFVRKAVFLLLLEALEGIWFGFLEEILLAS
jgi:hypothetical protein